MFHFLFLLSVRTRLAGLKMCTIDERAIRRNEMFPRDSLSGCVENLRQFSIAVYEKHFVEQILIGIYGV